MSQEPKPSALSNAADKPSAAARQLLKTLRRTVHWSRRWAKSSKPTEWISSIAGVLTVVSALGAALFLYFNGFFDQKRSELEARRSELEIKITKAEIDRDRLATTKGFLESSISELRIALREKEDDLRKSKAELETAKHALDLMNLVSQEQDKWDSIRTTLFQYSSGDYPLTVQVYRHAEREHPRHIWGIDISGSRYGPKTKQKDIDDVLGLAAKLPELRLLSITDVDASRSLGAICQLNLTSLYLRNCGLTDNNIGGLQPASILQVLCLSDNNISKLPILREPLNLKALSISGTKASDESIASLVNVANGLQMLHCGGTDMSDATFRSALERCPNLRELDCAATKVTVACIDELVKGKRDIVLCCGKEHIDPDKLDKDRSLMGNLSTIAILRFSEYKQSKSGNADYRYNAFAKNQASLAATDSFWPKWVEVDWSK